MQSISVRSLVGTAVAATAIGLLAAGCGSSKSSSRAAAPTATTSTSYPSTPPKPKRARESAAKPKTPHHAAAPPKQTGTARSTSTAYATGATAEKSKSSPGVTVDARGSRFGTILVDSNGRTLYLFVKDKTTASTCYGSCASVWPPYDTSGVPQAGPGVQASLLGTTKRRDGTTEVTYAGHPLYYFAGDSAPGQSTGQGLSQFGAQWWVLSPSGSAITSKG